MAVMFATLSCTPDQQPAIDGAPPDVAAPACVSAERPPVAARDWDPSFTGIDVARVRAIGGYYRALAATTVEQHRSAAGPTFRLQCRERLRVRVLFGVPQRDGLALPVRLVALLDYRQVEVEIDGVRARAHAMNLAAGAEHTFELSFDPMSDGIHRLVILFLEDDQQHGLFGSYDLIADVYVGQAVRPLQILAARDLGGRADVSVRGSGYGIRLSSRPDEVRLAGNVTWAPSLDLFATYWGDGREGARSVAIVALQDFEELDIGLAHPFVLATPDRVSTLRFRPRRPTQASESIRIVMATAPEVEMAPRGTYETQRRFKVYTSQKSWIRAGP